MAYIAPQHRSRFAPDAILSADEIVVKVSDILYDYLPPDSGVEPVGAVREVAALADGPAGVAACVEDAMHPELVDARDVVMQLHHALEAQSLHPTQTIDRLLGVVESSLAVEVYDREMRWRQPRDVDSWH